MFCEESKRQIKFKLIQILNLKIKSYRKFFIKDFKKENNNFCTEFSL